MGYCPGNITHVLNGDNFKHVISFSDIVNGQRQVVDIQNANITATYYASGSQKKYIATKIGQTLTNCILDIENKKIKVIFEGYDLDNGEIQCSVKIEIPDTDYPDGYATFTRYLQLGVSLENSDYFLNGNI